MKKEQTKGLENSLKLLVKTSFIVFIGLMISKILGYLYRIIIARYYGPEVYGLFALAFSIIMFFGAIGSLGLMDGLLRFIPRLRAQKKFDEARYLFNRTIRIYLVIGIVISILLIALSDFIAISVFHNPSLSILIKILGSITVFSFLMNTLLNTLRAFEEIGWHSFVYNIFQNVARLFILIVLILMGFKSGGIAVGISFALGAVLTFLIAYIVCKRKIGIIFGDYKEGDYSSLRKEFFSYSWPIVFYSVISLVFYWIDTFSLGYYKSAVEVGLYNAAVPIAMLLGFFPDLFMQLFFPMINKEYSSNNFDLIKQLSKQVTKWIFIVILPVFALLFLFPGAAINILFGAQYLPAENALRLLLIGSFISAISIVSVQLVSMMGKSKLVLMNIIIACVTNFVLNSILVPMQTILFLDNSNGLVGAALATLISLGVFNLLFIIETKKYLSFIPLRRKMLTIALVSIIPITILLYLRNKLEIGLITMVILLTLFFLVYFVLILLFKAFDKNDWMIIKIVFKKIRGMKNSIS